MSIAYESDTLQKLDDIADIFKDIDPKNPPSMRAALEDLKIPKKFIDEAIEDSGYFIEDRQEKKLLPKTLPMTVDEFSAIYCYSNGSLDDKDEYNMFEMINKALYTKDNKKEAVRPFRKYLFLLLSGLRKLPRTIPEDNILYRGLKTHVTTAEGGENIPYAVDKVKTWWGFTSTSVEDRAASTFLKDHKGDNPGTGTMITIRGRIWGYDISHYATFESEREFLVEPERQMKIVSVHEENDIIYVDVEMLDSELPLVTLIPPKESQAKQQKENPVDSSIRIPQGFWADNVWWNGAKLSWNNIEIPSATYQIAVPGKFFLSPMKPILKTTHLSCELKDLEPQKEYKLHIRVGNNRAWSKWSDPLIFETPALNPPERLLVKNTLYNELEITWEEVPSAPFIRTTYKVEAEASNGTKKIAYEGTERKFRMGVEEKSVFKIRVQAGVDSRWSAWSQDVQGKWENIPVPSNINVDVDNKKACIVSWNKVSGRNITYQAAFYVNGSADAVLGSPVKELRYEYDSEAEINSVRIKVRALKDGVAGKWSEPINM